MNDGQVTFTDSKVMDYFNGLSATEETGEAFSLERFNVVQPDSAEIGLEQKHFIGCKDVGDDESWNQRTRINQTHSTFRIDYTDHSGTDLDADADFDDNGRELAVVTNGPSYLVNNWNEVVVGGTKLADMPDQTETIDGTEYTRKVIRYRRRGVEYYRVFRDKTNDTSSTFGYSAGGTDYLANEWIYVYTGSSTDDQTISNDLADAANRRDVDYRG